MTTTRTTTHPETELHRREKMIHLFLKKTKAEDLDPRLYGNNRREAGREKLRNFGIAYRR